MTALVRYYSQVVSLRYYRLMKRKRILLIEPDTILAQNYSIGLRRADNDVCHVAGGQAAIGVLDTYEPDIIVLELLLPGHNGYEFMHELRSYTDLQDVPIILLTFVPQPDVGLTDLQLERLGIAKYLYKPITPVEDVVLAVESVT